MATGSLKTMTFIPAAGTTSFSVALLSFCRLVKVTRESMVHYIHFTRSVTAVEDKGVLFDSFRGKFTFKAEVPFTGSERLFIIYKEPLI